MKIFIRQNIYAFIISIIALVFFMPVMVNAAKVTYKCDCTSVKKGCTEFTHDDSTGKKPKTCSNCSSVAAVPGKCSTSGGSSNFLTGSQVQDAAKSLNPATINDPEILIGKAIKLVLQFVGVITLGFFVYGGIMFMIAGGNSEQKGKAVKVLVWAAVGVVVIAGSYMFVNYLFTKIIV